MSGLAELGKLWHTIGAWLFPVLEDELGELDDRHREFVAVCEICEPGKHLAAYRWGGNGCPPKDRLALCKAFIAKAVWDFLTPTTRDLIDGRWPSQSVPPIGATPKRRLLGGVLAQGLGPGTRGQHPQANSMLEGGTDG